VIGRAVFGESMFSRHPNASKIALLFLDQRLADGTFGLIDCQVPSAHLLSMGATAMPRLQFVETLSALCDPADAFAKWPADPISAHELV
ncbi:MAG: leucyl/phenylalanyl-tRNA--protein transferase, partial [Gammaproteobacteria bacterium]|nr:leucyl/phenylalanyl-tRNA--protein transferase [Gammaproteobacteria bacterium]